MWLCDLLLTRPQSIPLALRRWLHERCYKNAEYLFRGTTRGFPGHDGVRELHRTCTSTDPLVATLFAIESSRYGEGVVHIALRRRFRRLIVPANNYENLEREVAVNLLPVTFAARSDFTITAQQARDILVNLGLANIPPAIANLNHFHLALVIRARITEEHVQEFIKRAIRVAV